METHTYVATALIDPNLASIDVGARRHESNELNSCQGRICRIRPELDGEIA